MGIETAYPGLAYLIEQDRANGFSDGQIMRNIAVEVEAMRKRGVSEQSIDEWLGTSKGEPTFGQQVVQNSVQPFLAGVGAIANVPMSFALGGLERPGAVDEVFKNAAKRGVEGALGQPFGPSQLYESRTGQEAPWAVKNVVDPLAYAAMPMPAALGGSLLRQPQTKVGLPPMSPQVWNPTRREIQEDVERILVDSISESPKIGTKKFGELQMGQMAGKKQVTSMDVMNAFPMEYFQTHTPEEAALDLIEKFKVSSTKAGLLANQLFKAHTAGLTKPAELARPLLSGKTPTLMERAASDFAVESSLVRLADDYKRLKAEGWWKRGDALKKEVQAVGEYERKLKESGFDVSKVSMGELTAEELAQLREKTDSGVASLVNSVLRLGTSPYKLARDTKEQYLWLVLDEALRDYHKFLRQYSSKFLEASKGIAKGSDESLEAGWWLDKKELPRFTNEKARKLYADFRQIWQETGEIAVERGLFKKEDLKDGYFHRVWDRLIDKDKWLAGTQDEVARLKTLRTSLSVEGKELGKEEARRLQLGEEALERIKKGEVRVMFDFVPQNVFAPFTMKRKGGEGYSFDAVNSMYFYLNDFAKKVYLEPAVKKGLALANTIEDSGQRSYWKHILQRYMDLPVREGAFMKGLDNASRALTTLEFIKDMGLSMRSVVMNGTQNFNTMVDVGPVTTGKAVKALLQDGAVPGFEGKGARQLFQESGHALDMPWDWESMRQDPSSGKLAAWLDATQNMVGKPFQTVEKANRAVAYVAGLFEAGEKGLQGEAARRYADAIVKRTQFLYGKTGAFLGQTNPIGRVAFQFGTFPIKSMEMYHTWAGEGPTGLAKLLSHAALSSMIVHGGTEALGLDLSYMFGLGVNPIDMYKAVEHLKKGELEQGWMQTKYAASPFTGGVGGSGVLPSGAAPVVRSLGTVIDVGGKAGKELIGAAFSDNWDEALSHLKDTIGSEMYRLIPLQGSRLYEAAKAISLGEVVDPVTGRRVMGI